MTVSRSWGTCHAPGILKAPHHTPLCNAYGERDVWQMHDAISFVNSVHTVACLC